MAPGTWLIPGESDPPAVTLAATQATDGKSVTLTFSGSLTESADAYHSLVDGNYQLKVISDNVWNEFGSPLDGNGDGEAGDDYATASTGSGVIYRLFGDDVGNDRYVGTLDFSQFLAAYESTSSIFDFNGDGAVDDVDYKAFQARYGTGLNTP